MMELVNTSILTLLYLIAFIVQLSVWSPYYRISWRDSNMAAGKLPCDLNSFPCVGEWNYAHSAWESNLSLLTVWAITCALKWLTARRVRPGPTSPEPQEPGPEPHPLPTPSLVVFCLSSAPDLASTGVQPNLHLVSQALKYTPLLIRIRLKIALVFGLFNFLVYAAGVYFLFVEWKRSGTN
uniref:Uncharacterized protein n=1 Tax=Timema shepardi TaxID=629360 RepID=A0A7R9B4L9_TIMSH|nr:unnamed protein product [Timema shepardi]